MKMMSNKKEFVDELVDEVVDEVVDEINKSKTTPSRESFKNLDGPQTKNADELERLKNRIVNLENRMEKYISSFKLSSVEFERQISEKSETTNEDIEKEVTNLQGQMENLRTSMIRLGNELRRIRENLLRENLWKV